MKGVEHNEHQKAINIIVQSRVVERLCLDCGKPLEFTKGYCDNIRCGHVKNPVTYTDIELAEAKFIEKKNKRK